MSSDAQKKYGYPLPENEWETETVNFCLTIPAGIEWEMAMRAQLDLLGRWWYWKRDPTRLKAASDAATNWRDLLAISEECPPVPIDCEEVEACLTTSPTIGGINDTIDVLESDIVTIEDDVTGSGDNGYKPSSITKTMNESAKYPKFVADLIEPDGSCDDDDKDKLWDAIVKLVFYVHGQNAALLANIAAATDLSQAYQKYSDNVPLAAAFNLLDTLNLMDDILLNLANSYTSSVTESFLYDVCEALFCAATTCTFSIENFTDYVAGQAGGSFDAGVTTLLDLGSSLIGQTTGGGIFYALSWLQMTALGLGEKFASSMNLENLCLYVQSSKPDGAWRAYATSCYTHSGGWTIVLDWAGDYVKSSGEIVYRMGLADLNAVSGSANLLQQYANGLYYGSLGSSFINKRLNVSNAGALFTDAQVNWKRFSGPATAQLTVISNLYTPPANTSTSSSFTWDTAKALRGVGSPTGSISYIQFQWNQNLSSQACQSMMRYTRITGSGELPIFT